jgi:L-alanine-DL-glutamate epimerase-like enolase superfamily enzyme
MRLTRLSTAVLEANFDWVFVRVDTDAGVTGYGEAFLGPGVTAVIRQYQQVLEGEDITSLDRVLRRLRSVCVHASPGLCYHAISGIEAAILDALGKKWGLPVWQILGGKYRDSIRIYADCHGGEALESITPLLVPRTPQWMRAQGEPERKGKVSLKHHGWDASEDDPTSPHAYQERAKAMVARGFHILKFDVDVPTPYETDEYNRHLSAPEIEHMASLVKATRDAVGPEIGLAIDCHWNYNVQSAIEMARAVEPYRLMWLEDPIPPENIPAIGQVQANTRTPIATGENHYHRLDFERLITEARLRVLAPDVQKMGLWEGRKLADMAEMHYVNLTLHNIAGPLGTMAGVHLSAAIPNLIALEWHAASVPFFDKLVKNAEGPMIRGGHIAVPDRPGFGIELDLDEMYKYRKPGEPFFE